ncbi:hypothetical protein MKW94_022761 [Papaver nudicaule]|uniref:Uncharacterized protein n=1 Tax=Papaver nudicaule TaxID=74823 RepID=A0AA42AYV2_PAPNU|nr:hypothetical protein [Papaver nudicaule]
MKFGCEGFEVSKHGLGCSGLSGFYCHSKPDSDIISLIHPAIDKSKHYALVGVRDKVEVATKFGITYEDGNSEICGDPEYVRAACEASLDRL